MTAIIEATPEDAERAQEAIARALCPDESHPGQCPVPWTTMICRFEDLDDDEQAAWQADFDADRDSARTARPLGT
ncbi:MAG: hypothetical protein M3Q48_02750 [Actinomycetota bacterium]|nr:hypothetical protein [Actinomycetota bacterium]